MANEQFNGAVAAPAGGELATNKVLKNTYMLLAATLAFAALTGGVAMALGMPPLHPFLAMGLFMGLSYLVHRTANSGWGLLTVFLFTGFVGAYLGPIIGYFLESPKHASIVPQAFGLTAFVFLGLSGYVLTTKADMSFLRGFVVAGILVAIGLCVGYVGMTMLGVQVPTPLILAVSGFFVLLGSAMILWQTGEIVSGGETNYIRATTTLFVGIYYILVSLLNIFGIMGDD